MASRITNVISRPLIKVFQHNTCKSSKFFHNTSKRSPLSSISSTIQFQITIPQCINFQRNKFIYYTNFTTSTTNNPENKTSSSTDHSLHNNASSSIAEAKTETQSSSSNKDNSSNSASSKPSSTSISSARRIVEGGLTVLFLYSLYLTMSWLSYWPEPMHLLLELAQLDPLIQAKVGEHIKASYFWTGNVKEYDFASIIMPISGEKGSATVYGRAIFDHNSKQWKIVYLHASISPLAQKYTLFVPQKYTHISSTAYSAQHATSNHSSKTGQYAVPANFDPNELPEAAKAKYKQFLEENKLTELKPDPAEDKQQQQQQQLAIEKQ